MMLIPVFAATRIFAVPPIVPVEVVVHVSLEAGRAAVPGPSP
jgi:hypothetical protein